MDAAETLPDLMSTDRKQHVARIVRDAGQRLLRYIRARVGSDAEAEDVLQDVWQRLVATLDSGPIEQVGAWLYAVARHRIVDGYRRPKLTSLDAAASDETDETDTLGLLDVLVRDDDTPRSAYRRQLFWEYLQRALAELPPEQRQVFAWHELEGLSFQQIAARTGENLNTLLARKRYAVLHLRRRLGPLREEFLD